ncbi:MAG: type II toxin-antitoxin system HicA family toxin [Sulfuritalea sp.]|nr:type II toxin-antitoxin system HicA family toxin [Sulfuritalea sp.]MDP1982947.1 type II toxin-antitoxin system HicA family toxin [Sulfuritalea sp.]
MNTKQRKTLETIFAKPTAATLEWARIETVLVAAGCRVIEGRGSRVRFEFAGRIAAFHRPHPTKEAKPYQVELAREFLESIGVKP